MYNFLKFKSSRNLNNPKPIHIEPWIAWENKGFQIGLPFLYSNLPFWHFYPQQLGKVLCPFARVQSCHSIYHAKIEFWTTPYLKSDKFQKLSQPLMMFCHIFTPLGPPHQNTILPRDAILVISYFSSTKHFLLMHTATTIYQEAFNWK